MIQDDWIYPDYQVGGTWYRPRPCIRMDAVTDVDLQVEYVGPARTQVGRLDLVEVGGGVAVGRGLSRTYAHPNHFELAVRARRPNPLDSRIT